MEGNTAYPEQSTAHFENVANITVDSISIIPQKIKMGVINIARRILTKKNEVNRSIEENASKKIEQNASKTIEQTESNKIEKIENKQKEIARNKIKSITYFKDYLNDFPKIMTTPLRKTISRNLMTGK